MRFPNLRRVTFVSKVKCGLVHIVEHRNDLGTTIISEGIYNAQNYKIEVETVVECPEIIYVNENNSCPITPDNYYLVDDNTMQKSDCKVPFLDKVRMNHLNAEGNLNLRSILTHYSELFHGTNLNLTFTNTIKHKIITKDDIPVFSKTYRYPYIHKEEVKRQTNEKLSSGIIRPYKSSYSAPIWIVPKKANVRSPHKCVYHIANFCVFITFVFH